MASVNTIGTVRVACSKGPTTVPPLARMTSGASATNSAAYRRRWSESAAQRVSMRTLRPSVQPNCCSPCTNAARRATPSGASVASALSTPMVRIRSPCCARAASGHAAAAPLSSDMNSRRFKPKPPVLPTERIAYLCEGRRLLRCGILVQLMSQITPASALKRTSRAFLDMSASCAISGLMQRSNPSV